MKILGVVIQNKKGSNLLIASSTSITTKSCVRYSHLIYEHILESYRTDGDIQVQGLKLKGPSHSITI